ncbi:GNAT family N-acetyltransferase [Bacillus kexueae]|uniref:GNAT family N-acetyltransferase n=1 Tax=Aeribacillus kexueae TaxID=2078952 RepID=UPI001FAEC300|nr:GNAT family N-acetyltransferase [Bacillus kexueae]
MYQKELFLLKDGMSHRALIRNYDVDDFDSLINIQRECFPPPFPKELWWNEDQLYEHVHRFQDGALCMEVDGEIVGSMTGLIVPFNPKQPNHTWEEITDNGYIRNHSETGNTLYVVDISVRPSYRKLGIGKWLMFSMYEVVIQRKLDRLLGGGRMPGYHKVQSSYSPESYVEHVTKGKLKDPVLTFLLKCGRTPLSVVPDYLEDEESCHYGVLMEWKNPFRTQHSEKKAARNETNMTS